MENNPLDKSDKQVLKEIYLHQHAGDNELFQIFEIYEEDVEENEKECEIYESNEKIEDQKPNKPNFSTNCTKRHELNSALLKIKKIDGFNHLKFLSHLNAGIEQGFDMAKFLKGVNTADGNFAIKEICYILISLLIITINLFIDKTTKEISCLNDKLSQNKGVTTSSIINISNEHLSSVEEHNANHNSFSAPSNPRQSSENYLIVTDDFGAISIENNSSIPSPILPVIEPISSTTVSPPNKSSKMRITTTK